MKKTKLFIKIAGIALILSLLSFNQESNAGPKKKEKQKDSMQEKGTSPMPQHPGLPMAMPTPEGGPDSGLVGGTGVQFSDKKANILKRMGTEKEGLDKAIVCITAAKKEEDLRECHKQRGAQMVNLNQMMRDQRKKKLQDELKQLETTEKQ